jgi:hypothetical protein
MEFPKNRKKALMDGKENIVSAINLFRVSGRHWKRLY